MLLLQFTMHFFLIMNAKFGVERELHFWNLPLKELLGKQNSFSKERENSDNEFFSKQKWLLGWSIWIEICMFSENYNSAQLSSQRDVQVKSINSSLLVLSNPFKCVLFTCYVTTDSVMERNWFSLLSLYIN